MEKPKEEDIERVRDCQICKANGDGPACVACELDGLFQDYEARLFRLNKEHGEIITSAEEALHFQKKNPRSIIMIGTNQSYSARREMLGKELWSQDLHLSMKLFLEL
ncbi:hypothetical protein SLA2020_316590 [Shorea laevis]